MQTGAPTHSQPHAKTQSRRSKQNRTTGNTHTRQAPIPANRQTPPHTHQPRAPDDTLLPATPPSLRLQRFPIVPSSPRQQRAQPEPRARRVHSKGASAYADSTPLKRGQVRDPDRTRNRAAGQATRKGQREERATEGTVSPSTRESENGRGAVRGEGARGVSHRSTHSTPTASNPNAVNRARHPLHIRSRHSAARGTAFCKHAQSHSPAVHARGQDGSSTAERETT